MTDPMSLIPIVQAAAATKIGAGFVDLIVLKLFGKSRAVIEAESKVEADKRSAIWFEVEKPLWLELETAKMQRQYSNLGKVIPQVIQLLTIEKSNISDNNDFFSAILEHAKDISNEEMQTLIAGIIAGEYNTPGTYSMSTLQSLKMLGKHELELFEKICSLLIDDELLPKVLFTGDKNVKNLMKNMKIDFGSLQTLQSLGIFLPNDMINTIPNNNKEEFVISYFDKKLIYLPQNENTEIKLPGYYGLSIAGSQIYKHIKPVFSNGYYDWLKENYKIPNYVIKK